MEVERGETGRGKELAALLAAYRKKEAVAHLSLSLSQNPNVPAAAVIGNKGASGQAERQAECKEVFDGLECPVECLRECGDDLQDALKAMLLATQGDEQKEQLATRLVIPLAMACMEDAAFIAGRRGKEISDFVVNAIDNLTPAQCSEVLEILLNNVSQDGQARKLDGERYRIEIDIKCFDFIPKLLMIAAGGDKIEAGGMMYSGAEYKDYVIGQLHSINWPRRLVLGLADTIRCLRLTQGQLLDCAKKMMKEAKKMDLQDLPHLVYHSLLLSAQGHRDRILRGIIELFNSLDEDVVSEGNDRLSQKVDVVQVGGGEHELCQAESTVLQHFDFAIKQDQSLGQDIIKILKQRQGQLSMFEFALLLQLSSVQRCAAAAMQLLRKAAEHDFAYENKRASSVWIEGIRDLIAPSSVTDLFRKVLQRTRMGWEHLVPGIVAFALHLLATSARRCTTDASTGTKTVAQSLASLCMNLLEKAFTLHTSARDEILSHIFSRVITRDDTVPLFVSLLAKITARCSRDVLDSLPKVKESIEYISFMHPQTAVSFLSALGPIMRVQGGLQDYVMIVLRKALFSREGDARVVALNCMLHLATTSSPPSNEDRGAAAAGDGGGSSSSGRTSVSVSPPMDTLTLELIGQIRRCMSQQMHMRQRLYDGLCDVVRAKPAMLDTVAGILVPQLMRYVIEDGNIAQVQLQRCIEKDTGAPTEPLPHLLRCTLCCVYEFSEILAKAPAQGDDEGVPEALAGGQMNLIRLSKLMEKISEWLVKVDLQDFELERLERCSADDSEGTRLLAQGKLLVGVYEVLLEHALTCHHVTFSHLETRCFVLFQRLKDVQAWLKVSKGIKEKGDKTSKAPQPQASDTQTMLTMQYFLLLLSATNENIDTRHSDTRIEARARASAFGNVDLNVHALQSCLKQVQEMHAVSCSNTQASTDTLQYVQKLAPLLLRQFYANTKAKRNIPPKKSADTSGSSKKRSSESFGKPKAIGLLALECLDVCIHVACTRGTKEQIADVASGLVDEILNVQGGQIHPDDSISQVGTADHAISSCVRRFQDIIDSLMQQELVDLASCVISSLMTLLSWLPSEIREVSFDWFKSLCKSPLATRCKPSVLKDLITAYLGLSVGEARLQTALSLSNDVRIVCGWRDVDAEEAQQNDEPIEHGTTGADEDDARCAIYALCDFVKASCDETEWVLAHVEMISRPDIAHDDERSDLPEHVAQARANDAAEDEALVRLHRTIEVILPVALCNLHMPANSEALISTLCRIYRTAETAARLLSSNVLGNPRSKFTSLMRTVGSKLNVATYEAIFAYTTIHQDNKSNMDVDDDGKKGSNARSIKAQISKELKLIPNIIFYIESLEKHLIKINQRAKDNKISVDLMKTFKPSKSRGFKIDFSRVPEKEERENSKKGKGKKRKKGEGDEEQDGYDDEEEDNRHAKKKKNDDLGGEGERHRKRPA